MPEETTCQKKQKEAFEWLDKLINKQIKKMDRDREKYGKLLRPGYCYLWQEVERSMRGQQAFEPWYLLEFIKDTIDQYFNDFGHPQVKDHFFEHFIVEVFHIARKHNLPIDYIQTILDQAKEQEIINKNKRVQTDLDTMKNGGKTK